MLVTGANGAGKTNLLESLHVGTQGFSPRTRADQQLVRLGADGARIALAGDRDGRPLSLEVTLQQARQAREAERRSAALRRAVARRGRDARLHPRPPRRRQGRPGRAARVLRPDARPAAAELARRFRSSTQRRSGSGTPRCAASQVGAPHARPSRPGPSRSPSLGAQLVESRRNALAVLSPAFAERAGELGLPDAALDYTGEPPTVARCRAGSSVTSSAASPGSAHTWTTSRSARAIATCAASARRESSGWPSSRSCSPRPR